MTATIMGSVDLLSCQTPSTKRMARRKKHDRGVEPSQGFQFISVTDYASVRSSKNVSLVRGHVMRQMRRQQQQPDQVDEDGKPIKPGTPSICCNQVSRPQPPSFSSFQNSSMSRLISIEPPKKVRRIMPQKEEEMKSKKEIPQQEEEMKSKKEMPQQEAEKKPQVENLPLTIDACSTIEPATYPIPMDADADFMLDYYLSTIIPNFIGLYYPPEVEPINSLAICNALSSALWMQSILCVSASIYSVSIGLCSPCPLSLVYRSHVIRGIYEECQKPGDAATVATLMGITCLMTTEVIYGDVEALKHHMKGIEELIALRGGSLDNFENADLIKRVMPWLDHNHALFTHTPPRFTVDISPHTTIEITSQDQQSSRHHPFFLTPTLSSLLLLTRQLTGLRTHSLNGHILTPTELDHFLRQRDHLEHELICLLPTASSFTSSCCSPHDLFFVIALVLYISLHLRIQSPRWAICRHLASELRLALTPAMQQQQLDDDDPQTGPLLWALFVGASIEDVHLKTWFLLRIRDLVPDWETTEGMLRGVVWPEERVVEAKDIWMEAMGYGWCDAPALLSS